MPFAVEGDPGQFLEQDEDENQAKKRRMDEELSGHSDPAMPHIPSR